MLNIGSCGANLLGFIPCDRYIYIPYVVVRTDYFCSVGKSELKTIKFLVVGPSEHRVRITIYTNYIISVFKLFNWNKTSRR